MQCMCMSVGFSGVFGSIVCSLDCGDRLYAGNKFYCSQYVTFTLCSDSLVYLVDQWCASRTVFETVCFHCYVVRFSNL